MAEEKLDPREPFNWDDDDYAWLDSAKLLARTQRDAAVIAELVAAASVQCHCGSNAAHEAARAVIAKYRPPRIGKCPECPELGNIDLDKHLCPAKE